MTGMPGSGNSKKLIGRAKVLAKKGAIFLRPRDEEMAKILNVFLGAREKMDIADLPNSLQGMRTLIDRHLLLSRE